MSERKPLVWGNVKDFHLPDLLVYLHWTRKTGVLYITRERVKKHIYIRDGIPTAARSNLKSELMGEFLVAKKIINREQQERAVELQKTEDGTFGAVLMKHGMIDKKDLFIQARRQFLTIVFSLFGLNEGFYKFEEHELPDGIYCFQVAFSNLLIFGIRQISDPKVIRDMIGNLNQIPMPSDRFEEFRKIMFTQKEIQVIAEIDEKKTIQEIVNRVNVELIVCLKTLLILVHHDFVKLKVDFKDEQIAKIIDIEDSAAASLGFDSYRSENPEEETAVAGTDFLVAPENIDAIQPPSPEETAPSSNEAVDEGADPGGVEAAPGDPGERETEPPIEPFQEPRKQESAKGRDRRPDEISPAFRALIGVDTERESGPFARAYKNQKQKRDHGQMSDETAATEEEHEETRTPAFEPEVAESPIEEILASPDEIPGSPAQPPPIDEATGPGPQEEQKLPPMEFNRDTTKETPVAAAWSDEHESPVRVELGIREPAWQETPQEAAHPEVKMVKPAKKKRMSFAYIAILILAVGFGIFSLSPWREKLQDRLFSAQQPKETVDVAQAPVQPAKPVMPPAQAPVQPAKPVMPPAPTPVQSRQPVMPPAPTPVQSRQPVMPPAQAPVQSRQPVMPPLPQGQPTAVQREPVRPNIPGTPAGNIPERETPALVTQQVGQAPVTAAQNPSAPAMPEPSQPNVIRPALPPASQEAAPVTSAQRTPAAEQRPPVLQGRTPPAPAVMPDLPLDPKKDQVRRWTNRLWNTPESKYTIQVQIGDNFDDIWEDREQHLSQYDSMVVGFQIKDWKAFTLLVGTFDSRQEGDQALQDLPRYIRRQGPLVKTMTTIKKGLYQVE